MTLPANLGLFEVQLGFWLLAASAKAFLLVHHWKRDASLLAYYRRLWAAILRGREELKHLHRDLGHLESRLAVWWR